MNFIALESAQKLSGSYYTDPEIAAFLTRWVLEIKPQRILEPACGDGAFFETISRIGARWLETVVGCELHAEAAQKASERGRALNGACEIAIGDFLEWYLLRSMAPADFDAVLGNPPFIRYQYLDSAVQARAEQIFKNFNLAFTKHTNAWVPFVIASLAMLRAGGRLAMVVPSELLHVIHARSLRQFLLQQCSHVVVIDPEDIWFGDTLQGVVLLLAQKRAEGDKGAAQVAITAVRGRDALKKPASEYFAKADFFSASILNGKWMVGLLNSRERALITRLERSAAVRPLGHVSTVDVGLVTGANKFFLVPDAIVEQYGLHHWAYPMFGRSDHVRGVIYDTTSHEENKRLGLPANFIWFGDTPMAQLPDGPRRYIHHGEAQGLAKRYKCRIRTPWYNVPSVYVAPIGLLKRSHHFPRLILNIAKAYTTDTAYRMTVLRGNAPDLVTSFVNSITALSSELEGRHYGGGVLELVPSEIEKVLVPCVKPPGDALGNLDKAIRDGRPAEEVLAAQDKLLLRQLGITKADRETLFAAWCRLRDRRQRTAGNDNEDAEDAED
jgi:adenine-specific DNA-methyltransferase